MAAIISLSLGLSGAVYGAANSICQDTLGQHAADRAMSRLYEGFLLVDAMFNDPNNPGGLDPAYIGDIGWYTETTHAVALGPRNPTPDGSLAPGSVSVIGKYGSSNLQSIFEGSLKAAYTDADHYVELHHDVPVVSAITSPETRRVTVNSQADIVQVRKDDVNNRKVVAIAKGVAQYYIPCKKTEIPTIDWIFFTIEIPPEGGGYIPQDCFLGQPNCPTAN